MSFSAPAGKLRATNLSPSQQAFVDKLQAMQALVDQPKLNMEVKDETISPIETEEVKHELDPAVGGEANMPDFHGRAHERDVSFEEHAEQMLTLSAEHDEEIRSIKEEMLAEQDALLVENQRLQRAVADNEATKLSGSDLRSRDREVHNAESRRDEYALKPLTEVTEAYLIIYQFDTPKGIEVEVGKEYWPDLAGLPDTIKGVIGQHINKAQMKLKIVWTEKDGKEVHDIEDLHMLLRPHCRFKLVKGPKGEALRLRGQSRVDFQSQQPKRTVTIDYTVGAQTRKHRRRNRQRSCARSCFNCGHVETTTGKTRRYQDAEAT